MRTKTKKTKKAKPKTKLGLPDLDHAMAGVLGSLCSPESKRGYRHAIDEFIGGIVPSHASRSTRLSSRGTGFTWKIAVWRRGSIGLKPYLDCLGWLTDKL